MTSFQISLTPHKKAAGRFIATVRRELQKAFAEEQKDHGITQASIAAALNVNRSVIHRQIVGHENMTLGRVGEIANILGRDVVFALVRPDQCHNFFAMHPACHAAVQVQGVQAAQHVQTVQTITQSPFTAAPAGYVTAIGLPQNVTNRR